MWDVRPVSAADAEEFRHRVPAGFGRDAKDDDESRERFEAIFESARTLAAYDGGEMVGTCAAFSYEVTVPGGRAVPMGGTTVITVRPTHRRRGVLRALMDRHLEDVVDHGEPLAGLWASESSIYSRFGYGIATWNNEISFHAPGLEFRPDLGQQAGTVRLLDPAEAARLIPSVYERHRMMRAGMLSRSEPWWTHRIFADPEEWRDGMSAQRYALFELDGESLGYAIYRQKSKWEDGLAEGKVDVIEVIANDEGAHTALWSLLCNIDLFPTVEYWNLPVDDPLPAKLTNPRRVKRVHTECLWVRIMDVPGALEARHFDSDGELSLEVVDGSKSPAAYRLEVSNGVGSCTRFTGPADLRIDLDVLGHLYLGGGDAVAMARGGRIDGDLGRVTAMNRMFRDTQAPWCPEVF